MGPRLNDDRPIVQGCSVEGSLVPSAPRCGRCESVAARHAPAAAGGSHVCACNRALCIGTDRFAVARRMAGLCRHGTRSGNQSGGRRTHRPSGLGVGDNRRYDGERGLRCGTDSGRSPGLGKCPSAARSGKPVFADQSAEYGRGPLAASAPRTCDGTRPRECHGYGNPWPVGHRRSCVGRRDCRFRWIGAGTCRC